MNGLFKAYSLVVTTALITMLLQARTNQNSVFDQITVHRINIVEPDGTPRLIISDHAVFPGLIDHGKEKPYARPFAGMLFYNNEGTENGGLVFGGAQGRKGPDYRLGRQLVLRQLWPSATNRAACRG